MGLDQYLHAKKTASGGEYSTEESKSVYQSIMALSNIGDFAEQNFPDASIEVKVAYWRKENAIHLWFVENCQGGEDECQTVFVVREKLEELRDLCREVLADKSKAGDLLPTTSGFFYGGTEYDEWYFSGLIFTADMIDKVLTLPDEWDFYYSSSW